MNLMTATAPAPALVRGFRHVLRPLVRLMLASGVTYPLISELLKGLFVEVAEREFGIESRPVSDSRISLLSGVHRKDVRRLRESGDTQAEVMPESVSLGGKLVTAWLSEPRFLDDQGNARPLPRIRVPSEPVCFEDLVASRSTDLRPRVVMDEWLRLGIAHLDERDRLVLNTDAFVPQEGLEEKLYFFAHNLHDHAAAAADNLLGKRPGQLERSLIYEGLSPEAIEHLEKRARSIGTKMLTELNRAAIEREEAEAGTRGPKRRFTCGVYFYSEPSA